MVFEKALEIFLASLALYFGVIVYTRLNGLRTFSKMTSFDFAMTIAVGSIMGAAALDPEGKLFYGLLAIAWLVLFQRFVAQGRRSESFDKLVNNAPLCLLWKGRLLEKNLRESRVTPKDVYSKLREANALDLGQVHAVVLETTGDISVLHGQQELNEAVLTGVRGIPEETQYKE